MVKRLRIRQSAAKYLRNKVKVHRLHYGVPMLVKVMDGKNAKSALRSLRERRYSRSYIEIYRANWDLARDYYALISRANSMRNDIIIYILGHTTVNDEGERCLVTNGRKLEKIKLESKVPVVLYTAVENGLEGENKFSFQTQRSKNSCKTPIGMFEQFSIPNSLHFVDIRIRKYYEI